MTTRATRNLQKRRQCLLPSLGVLPPSPRTNQPINIFKQYQAVSVADTSGVGALAPLTVDTTVADISEVFSSHVFTYRHVCRQFNKTQCLLVQPLGCSCDLNGKPILARCLNMFFLGCHGVSNTSGPNTCPNTEAARLTTHVQHLKIGMYFRSLSVLF